MITLDLPKNFTDRPSDKATPPGSGRTELPQDLTPPDTEPKQTATEDTSPASEHGLTSPEDLRLMQSPKLGGGAARLTVSETAGQETANRQDRPGDSSRAPETPGDQSEESGSADQAPEAPGPETPDAGSGEGGGGDGPFDRAPGEAGGDDDDSAKAELRRQTMGRVQETMDRIWETRTTADAEPDPKDAPLINEALINLTKASDADTADRYGGQLQNPTRQDIVDMRLAQDEAGDPYALLHLKELIWQERAVDSSRREALAHAAPGAGTPQAASDAPTGPTLLSAAVEAYEKQGKSPRELIDAAAAGESAETRDDVRRALFLEHAGRVIPEGGEYAESIKAEANQAASDIPLGRTLQEAPDALRAVTDSTVREVVLDRYMAAYFSATQRLPLRSDPDTSAVKDFLDVAPDILQDPRFDSYEVSHITVMMDHTKNIVDRFAYDAAREGGHAPVSDETIGSFMRQVSEWQVSHAVRNAKPAESVVEICRTDARNILRKQHLDTDELLARGAQEFMRRGDIDSARQMAEASQSPEGKLAVLSACWSEAQTTEDLERLSPGQTETIFNKEGVSVASEYRFRHALKSDNPADLEELARITTEDTYSPPASHPKAEAVGMLTARLSEIAPERALSFANDTVIRMVSAPTKPALQDLQPFHDVLAGSDNPDHLSLVHASILRSQGTEAEKLRALSELARKLKPGNADA